MKVKIEYCKFLSVLLPYFIHEISQKNTKRKEGPKKRLNSFVFFVPFRGKLRSTVVVLAFVRVYSRLDYLWFRGSWIGREQ